MISLDELRKSPERADELSAAERMEARRACAGLTLLLADEPIVKSEEPDEMLTLAEVAVFLRLSEGWVRHHGKPFRAHVKGLYSRKAAEAWQRRETRRQRA